MHIKLTDEELREYAKQHIDAAIKSIVRSEVATLIHQEMEKKLKDTTPHSIQVAVSGMLQERVKKVIDKSFETLNLHGTTADYKSWDAPVLFIQKIVLGIRAELQDRLWKYVSSKIGFDLNHTPKEKK